ncbi:DUF2470 domain-containing protein [Streptomyces sp. NRRL B-24484]|uniref:DUF2470 domain-containing protein n=1 Tax=Streptomyces sp. NRRL B-24484 TaxID=1463833 RepID=UPI000694EBD7|nr:DUF2470 domain-containing protein [Streptomyces sp. NRRL B-24484]
MSDAVPSAAERIRTLLEFASSVVLDVPGIDLVERPGPPPLVDCAVLPDGAVAVLVEDGSPVHRIAVLARRDGPVTAELDAVDVAPVALPHRIRGRAAVQGRLTVMSRATPARVAALFPRRRATGHVLLCLEPEHLAVEDLWGSACCVEPAEFAAAASDPLAAEEARLLQHLDASHADQVHALGLRAAGRRSAPGADCLRTVRPVSLDRFGLRLRLVGEDGRVLDARFEFGRPVRSAEELPEAMRRLFAHATADH